MTLTGFCDIIRDIGYVNEPSPCDLACVVRSSIGDDKFVIEFIGSFPKFTVNKIVELYQVDIGINRESGEVLEC